MAGGRPKGSKEIASKVRFIADGVIEKLGMQKCIEMLVDEIEEHGFSTVMPKLASFYPKEVQADITTHTLEDFVVTTATSQALDDSSPEETHVH